MSELVRANKPGRVFVCSMGDLFHDDVPTDFILRVFEEMAFARQHQFLVLTKRPERMLHLLAYGEKLSCDSAEHHQLLCMMPLPNVWLGVTAENQARADERIPLLMQTPAVLRFVSVEPLLGPVDLRRWLTRKAQIDYDALLKSLPQMQYIPRHLQRPAVGLDWVIVGNETGPKKRPWREEWVELLVNQCRAARVPLFVKSTMAEKWPIQLFPEMPNV
jgi:protein gp37